MTIHEHYSHWLPKTLLKITPLHSRYAALTLFNHILYSSPSTETPLYLRAHERVHLKQIFLDHPLRPITFYLLYLLQWAINGFHYLSIPLEIEAFSLQFSPIYYPSTFDPAFKLGKLPNPLPPI